MDGDDWLERLGTEPRPDLGDLSDGLGDDGGPAPSPRAPRPSLGASTSLRGVHAGGPRPSLGASLGLTDGPATAPGEPPPPPPPTTATPAGGAGEATAEAEEGGPTNVTPVVTPIASPAMQFLSPLDVALPASISGTGGESIPTPMTMALETPETSPLERHASGAVIVKLRRKNSAVKLLLEDKVVVEPPPKAKPKKPRKQRQTALNYEAPPTAIEGELMSRWLSDMPFSPEVKIRMVRDIVATKGLRRIFAISEIPQEAPSSTMWHRVSSCLTCRKALWVDHGRLGLLSRAGESLFLAPGMHYLQSSDIYNGQFALEEFINTPLLHGTRGFLIVAVGYVALLEIDGALRLLPSGMYHWQHPTIFFRACEPLTSPVTELGPLTLLTVPEGYVGVTFLSGVMNIVGHPMDVSGEPRMYLLSHVNTAVGGMLSLRHQTTHIDAATYVSRDGIDVVVAAQVTWRIDDAALAAIKAGCTMDAIRHVVQAYTKAAVERIIGHTFMLQPSSQNSDVVSIASLDFMSSAVASPVLGDLKSRLEELGVEVNTLMATERRLADPTLQKLLLTRAAARLAGPEKVDTFDAKAAREAHRQALKAKVAEEEAIEHAKRSQLLRWAMACQKAGDVVGYPEDSGAALLMKHMDQQRWRTLGVTQVGDEEVATLMGA